MCMDSALKAKPRSYTSFLVAFLRSVAEDVISADCPRQAYRGNDMRKLLSSAGALLLLLAGDVVAGVLEDGLAAYERRDYITANRSLYPLAEEGNASAQNFVGLMILRGLLGKEPDPDAAL